MLFRWLLRRHVILYNPALLLVLPKEERRLPLQVLSEEEMRAVLAARYDSGHLFLTQKGTGLGKSTLTQLAGRAIREQARLEKPGACHLFRHSMATQMLENGADTRHIQAMLGHEKLETTQVYMRVAIGHLKRVHERTHPAERKATRRKRKK